MGLPLGPLCSSSSEGDKLRGRAQQSVQAGLPGEGTCRALGAKEGQ